MSSKHDHNPYGQSPASQKPKRELDIDLLMSRIRKAVEPFAKAALFELAEEGYGSLFEQLVACMISIRTRDYHPIRPLPLQG